jgi:two-component system sensor histidine kinase KdpD
MAACCLTVAIAKPLSAYFDLANIIMLFLLTVVLVAIRLGRSPAIAAAFLSVGLFDFFFVPPHFTFAVADVQYLLTFGVMLAVALITAQLTGGIKHQAELTALREQHTRALYEMARAMAGAISINQVLDIDRRFIARTLDTESELLLADESGQLALGGDVPSPPWLDLATATAVHQTGHAAEFAALSTEERPVSYFPLKAAMHTRGVIVLTPRDHQSPVLRDQRDLLETVASLTAVAIERLHYVDVAHQTMVAMASERLRSSILSALSHDLRTPLTALVGLADTLLRAKPPLGGTQKEIAGAIQDQARQLAGLAVNLLDMARLHAGSIRLRREWQPIEEVIGASIKALEPALTNHVVRVALAPDLPLLEIDAVLMERVFCNLLENAVKYAPGGTSIMITGRRLDSMVEIAVDDQGPGLPPGDPQALFDMFVRGNRDLPAPGMGLGLAICRTIIEAHGGTISATNRPNGGASFVFDLPIGVPPAFDDTDDACGGGRPA